MIKVVINPGHGGNDRRNIGPTGYVEADAVLVISKYLAEELRSTGKFNVKLTRTTDKTMSRTARGTMAATFGADLYISQHTNAGGGHGTEVFYSVQRKGDKKLAADISKAVSETLGIYNRGAKTKPGIKYPNTDYDTEINVAIRKGVPHTILVEAAFHDHKREEAILKVDSNLKKIAIAQAIVICKYYNVSYKGSVVNNPKQTVTSEPRTVLKYGCAGEDVLQVQKILKDLGFYKGILDGKFENRTVEGVKAFQKSNKLVEDGIVGPKTTEAINKAIYPKVPKKNYMIAGDSGNEVLQLQKDLKTLGFYKGILDGKFENMTTNGVKDFQKAIGIKVDGSAGQETQTSINEILSTPICNTKNNTKKYAIRYIQYRVRTAVDGIFGRNTRVQVRKWQGANGLTVDGSVGPATWNKLL